MPRLSIVIPLLGDPAQLDDTLASVLQNRPANSEVLVIHNRPYDDPYGLAGEVRFIEAASDASLAECLNLGLRAARAAVVHVLRCGVEVSVGWAEVAMRHFRDAEIAAVAALVVSRDESRQVVSAGLGYRAEGVAWRLDRGAAYDELSECESSLCGPDILAAFYCKSTLEAVGGFSAHAADVATGVDAALAIRTAGFRCVLDPECVVRVDAASLVEKPGLRCGRDAERLFWRWASAHGLFRSVVGHTALLAGECVIGLWRPALFTQLTGRLFGVIQAASGRRRSQTEAANNSTVIPMADFATTRPPRRQDRQESSHAA
ncbi:MAG: hypothetical protein LLG00_11375 [Planctomycetaceae bacterium]|nr:hypothetical protein [Planctomycetaceae bacterium]